LKFSNRAISIVVTLLILATMGITLSVSPSTIASTILDDLLHQASVTFALAKSLNALISLFQTLSISATPIGMGVTLSIGELLDPVNDMVERFSLIMLAATVALGIQKIILTLSSSLYLTVSIVLTLILLWIQLFIMHQKIVLSFFIKALLFMLILRYGTLLFILLQSIFFTTTLSTSLQQEQAQLTLTKNELQAIKQREQQHHQEQSWLQHFKQGSSVIDATTKQLHQMQQTLEESMNAMTTLITQFVLLTILLPLLYLWLLIKLISALFSVTIPLHWLRL